MATLALGAALAPVATAVGIGYGEGIPELPQELAARLARYQAMRGAGFAGWLGRDDLLIATRSGDTTQLYRLREPDGAREQLTDYPDPIAAVAIPRGGGSQFLFAKDEAGSEEWQLFHYDLDARQVRRLSEGGGRNQGAVWARDGRRFAYSTTRRNGVDTDVHIMDLDGTSTPLIEGGGGWVVQDWSPDDRLLLALEHLDMTRARPWLVRVEDGVMGLLRNPHAPAAYGRLAFSPDGQAVYYTSDEEDEFRQLYRLDLRSGRSRPLSRGIRWDVEDFALSPDGRHLAFTSNEHGFSRLHLRSLPRHRRVQVPDLPEGVIALGGFSPDGARLALTVTTPVAPSAVYVLEISEGRLKRWTSPEMGGIEPDTPVAPSLITYPSFDRTAERWRRRIPAFYYRPAERPEGHRFPVLVSLHGGPEIQARPGFAAMTQFLVNELGIAVLVPNVRGSSGYGKTWLALDDGRRREDAVRDVGALLDWIAEQPELDPARVGVTGGSYGGYLTLASLIRYGERLRAGLSVVGISSFVTFLENTAPHRRDLRRAEYGDERDPAMRAFLESISPLTHAHRIRSPLFVAHGGNDPRVPPSEAEQIVRAVRENGVEVWYLLFHDEGHGFVRKPNRDHFDATSALFWQRHLLAENPVQPSPSGSDPAGSQ